MARFVRGEVVVLPFPFSDLSGSKRRPALVLADAGGGDLVLCQITSQAARDSLAIALGASDFTSGGLKIASNIRPNKLFTAAEGIVLYSAAKVKDSKTAEAVASAVKLLQS